MSGQTAATRDAARMERGLKVSIGDEIRRLREDAAMSQSQLSRLADVDKAYISRVEAAVAAPSVRVLSRIAAALGADLTVRMYPRTGPAIHDRSQSLMIEQLIRELHARW